MASESADVLQQSPPLLHPPAEGFNVTIGNNGSTGGDSTGEKQWRIAIDGE
jgi:hypothetical protein